MTPKEAFRQRLVETRVRFKRLSARKTFEAYLASGEWRGKAGGYAVQGLAGSFVVKMVGSYTNVVGLPLYETVDAAGRRRLPDPLRLAQCQLKAPKVRATRRKADQSRAPNAASPRTPPRCRSVPPAAATST